MAESFLNSRTGNLPNFGTNSNDDYQKTCLTFASEYRKGIRTKREQKPKKAEERMQSNWDAAHSEALCEYFIKGMSFAAIARAINAKFDTFYTRSAVLGRAARMGLAAAGRAQAGSPPVSIAETVRVIRVHERTHSMPWRLPPVFKATETAPLRCAGVLPRHLSLTELERIDCRYPYGGDADGEAITFCGLRRRPGSSYCAAHFDLSRGPGTKSERGADLILLKAAARPAWTVDQAEVDAVCAEFVHLDRSME
jgi:GcrA cell cycle regulator